MTFATLESRVNSAVVARLNNCVATVSGVSVAGIFSAAFADTFDMDGNKPSLSCLSSDVATAVRGTAVVINSVSYTVASGPQPDKTGMTLLLLEKV